eukprot:1137559-Pelagomonas_calceolata.AAC.1
MQQSEVAQQLHAEYAKILVGGPCGSTPSFWVLVGLVMNVPIPGPGLMDDPILCLREEFTEAYFKQHRAQGVRPFGRPDPGISCGSHFH